MDPLFTLTTGPVDIYPEVSRALARPISYDYDPVFLHHYETVHGKVARALGTDADHTVILQGEPVLGLEAAAASLISGQDTVLNLASGVYGAGFGEWAKRHCGAFHEMRVPFNEVIDPQALSAVLDAHPEVSIVCLCHHDTPSGTVNPADAIGHIVANHGALLIVDAVSSFGGMAITPAGCQADLFITGPNKCLGCPPGLSLLAISDRAWEKMKANPTAPRGSILSILDWEGAQRADQPFPFTPSVAEINALDAALDRYLSEGPEAIWARHALTAAACRAGIKAMGFTLWAADESFASPTCTAVRTPEGIDEQALRALIREHHRVTLSSGRLETLGRLTRIGHMGPTAHPLYAVIALVAYGSGVATLTGRAVDIGAGAAAAMAIIDGASPLTP
ncbi:pyridoxamine--pyruvate transaminase [Rhodospirillum sp. A1_3_36]|uniref:pyridoxamine--pyruvate transaminase n=1 Tax=Rhodospirillum sp. A1_3_36 TaxID=3391666 RepID=UPI0039A47FC8